MSEVTSEAKRWADVMATTKIASPAASPRADATIEMSNYRESDGIFNPGKTTVALVGGPVVMTATFTKVEHGIKLDDALFRKPKE